MGAGMGCVVVVWGCVSWGVGEGVFGLVWDRCGIRGEMVE